jgi:hypothetical protein
MMMQMLAAGGLPLLTDQVRTADEDNPEGYFELEAVKLTQRNADWLTEAPGKGVKVIYRLLEYLPTDYHYRVLFMDRPLTEIIASQQVMLTRRGTQGATVSVKELHKLFTDELRRVKSWLAAQRHMDCLVVPYASVLSDSRAESERISRFLGMSMNLDAMAACVDPQLHRQRS